MKRKILTMLRRSGEYLSGQQICRELGVSRTAVWKVINTLKEEGYEIEAVSNRGYRLLHAPDILTEAEIGSQREDLWKDCPLKVYEETDSTNDQARKLAEEGYPEGTLVVSDVQKSGRGRRGRAWETPAGTGIAMSLVLKPDFPPENASELTLLAAMAGRGAVRDVTGRCCKIKWPNDLVLSRKKFCGILSEMSLEEDRIRQVIVGIGLNINQEFFPEELTDKAVSLYLETGERWSRAEIICRLLRHFGEYYTEFCRSGDISFARDEYNEALISRNEEVRILTPGQEWTGRSLGINDRGSLLVERAEGDIREITAGEVSVRGLYRYT